MPSHCPHCGAEVRARAGPCTRCEGGSAAPRPAADPTADPPRTGTVAARTSEPGMTDPGATPATTRPRGPRTRILPWRPPPGPARPSAPPGTSPAVPSTVGRIPRPFVPPQVLPPTLLGAFLGRVLRGRWAECVRAALWPLVSLPVAALVLAVPRYGQDPDEVVVGYLDRARILLALLLKSVGGGLTLHGEPTPGRGIGLDGTTSVSLVPLTVTALWLVACYAGLRRLRSRTAAAAWGSPSTAGQRVPGSTGPEPGPTAGLEAAVRVSLTVAVGVLALALCAQPTVAGIRISSAPAPAALGALLLSLAVSVAVLHRAEADHWLRGRPTARLLLHVTGTALRALAVVLALGSLAAFAVLAGIDDLEARLGLPNSPVSPLVVALLVLPNLGVAALGLGWGVPLAATGGGSSALGGSYRTEPFGLVELARAVGPWAVTGALALGLVSALTVGMLTARRSADRGERLLTAGVFGTLFLVLAVAGGVGVSARGSATAYDTGGRGGFEAGLSLPQALLLTLLWVGPAVLAVPRSRVWPRLPGRAAPARGTAPGPRAATGLADRGGPGAPEHGGPGRRRSRAAVWVAVLAAACLAGGGATAGALLWRHHQAHTDQDGPAPTVDDARVRTDRTPPDAP